MKLQFLQTVRTALTFFGMGLMTHDFILECQKISDPYRFPPHGFWWGFLLIVISFIIELTPAILKTLNNIRSK
jgi:hypothetical protein